MGRFLVLRVTGNKALKFDGKVAVASAIDGRS
jgi:hypothetical protein